MYRFLQPAIVLMRRLHLLPKFLLVSFLFAIPAVLVTTLFVRELNKSIHFSLLEQSGVKALGEAHRMIQLTQQERALQHLAQAGNTAAAGKLSALRDQIGQQMSALAQHLPDSSTEDLAPLMLKGMSEIEQDWRKLAPNSTPTSTSGSAAKLYASYTQLIEKMFALSAQIADATNLTLDPKVETDYLIGLFSKSLPNIAEQVSDIAARGAPYIDTGLLQPNEDVLINAQSLLAAQSIQRIPAQLEAVYREDSSLKNSLDAQKQVLTLNQQFLIRTKNEILTSVDQTSGTEYLAAGQSAVDAWYGFADACAKLLDQALQRRIEKESTQRNFALLGIVTCLGFAAYLLAGFYRAFSQEIQGLKTAVNQVANGYLAEAVHSDGSDEIAQLTNAFDGMRLVLAGLVNEIRQGIASIDLAAQELLQGNADLSQRTEQQSQALLMTSGSMQGLTEQVGQNTQRAQEGQQNMILASALASNGGQAVGQMVSMMDGIQQSSKKIADIIGVIDSIAFQTNILALNAAVEAARAGEQGRGFAVVASEVRNLAQRSAGAAQEIKTLISTSVQQVSAGNQQVQVAGGTMQKILDAIRALDSNMQAVAQASAEQQSEIERVKDSVTDLEDITQQNTALVEEASAAAESLHVQTQKLSAAIAVFQLSALHSMENEPSALLRQSSSRTSAIPLHEVDAPPLLAASSMRQG